MPIKESTMMCILYVLKFKVANYQSYSLSNGICSALMSFTSLYKIYQIWPNFANSTNLKKVARTDFTTVCLKPPCTVHVPFEISNAAPVLSTAVLSSKFFKKFLNAYGILSSFSLPNVPIQFPSATKLILILTGEPVGDYA